MSKPNFIDISVVLREGAEIPFYASDLAAGADVYACLSEEVTIQPGNVALIPTGIKMAIPEGFEIEVRPRSSLALKKQVSVLNSPGTIDADYRGEVGIILINHGKEPFVVTHGMRIAQLVVAPVIKANFILQEALSITARGEGGFGSTGA